MSSGPLGSFPGSLVALGAGTSVVNMHRVLSCAVAFGVATLTMPMLIWFARRWRIEDRPDGELKPHAVPIPLLGGLGIAVGTVAGVIAGLRLPELIPVLTVGLGLAAVGLVDDVRKLPPRLRLLLQIAGGAALVLSENGLRLGSHAYVTLVAAAITAFLFVGCVNAVNMLDGIDGLCAGCSLASALAFAAVLDNLRDGVGTLLALALAGACAGFLIFNFQPARIFMGDSGSYFIGTALCVLLLRLERTAGLRGLVAGCLLLGVPAIDSSSTVLARVLSGRSPFAGDRRHIYDRMVDAGMSVRRTVLALYGASVAFATLGLVVVFG